MTIDSSTKPSDTAIEPLVRLEHITAAYRIDPVLRDIDWQWRDGERWAVIGGNGAGKTALANVICDELRPQKGVVNWRAPTDPSRDIVQLSFTLQHKLMDHDRRFDDSEVRDDAFDTGTTVAAAILQGQARNDRFDRITRQCGISHILDRGIRFISTGESRKTLLARALFQPPAILILDNPYEGLDRQSQQDMRELLAQLLDSDQPTLLLLQQASDIPAGVTHILHLEDGKIRACGEKSVVLTQDTEDRETSTATVLPPPRARAWQVPHDQPLIDMAGVSVSYNDVAVLTDIHWRFDWHQHCCISGPNGAGKSTLLSLIYGDNHKGYGQPLTLFGRRRGSGESVWEIKEKFGLVSTQLQLNHTDRTRVIEVIASGLYDSIGLYRECSGQDRDLALQWLTAMELETVAHKPFNQLSFGQQRLALVARAMVKSPLILILDEPCIGLDAAHRQQILALIDQIAQRGETHILYVSHTAGEQPSCITQQLTLMSHTSGGYTAQCQ